MIPIHKDYEVYCRGCEHIIHTDVRLAPGMYSFIVQKYGKTHITRVIVEECLFCKPLEGTHANQKRGAN